MDKTCFLNPMKLLATAIFAFLLIGCKSDDAAEAPPAPPEAKASPARSREIAGLLNKKHQLSKKLEKLVASSQLDPNGQLETIMKEQQQAFSDLQNIHNTHPSLQKLNKDLAFWQSNQRSARTSKREFEIQQAARKIVEISTKIQNLSRELPAIREAEDRITRSQKQIKDLQRALAEESAEGQEIVKELQSIEEQITSME
ncbi:hypothetical protein N9C66_06820 [Akkermansiaceae bacterium]|nr:hypothetical protein [Akkermansiaceae bacterium]